MGKIIKRSIEKDKLINELETNVKNGGRLVCINGYVNEDGQMIVVYTIEHDEIREILKLEDQSEIPTATSIYIGAAWFEEEIEEVMPVKFIGLKRSGRLFLPDEFKNGEGKILVLPLNELKKSLLNGSRYIGEENSIGLVTYSNDVNINLPIEKFDLNQRSLFTGAVQDMDASGGTATFDAIAVAVQMLLDEKEKNPDAKLMLFVLSDGETNIGHSLDDLREILESVKIPVHTIGYNANIEALENISRINEATSINADSDDVIYKLGSLFNAEM